MELTEVNTNRFVRLHGDRISIDDMAQGMSSHCELIGMKQESDFF
jgi:hypothetical protein